MSLNTAHANNGVLLHSGEYILLHCDNVTMEFSGQDNPAFKGSKHGRIYLTSHRMIFNSKKENDLKSFSAPFVVLTDVTIEQPVFSANYIKGKVRAQPNGNFIGEVKFKLHFKSGGAIEYGQALLRAASTAQSNFHQGGLAGDDPPPYTPSGNWHEAPPPAYQPPPGYYGWIPQHEAFSGPAPNSVFVTDNPPPYPGIGGPPPYAQQPAQPAQQYTPASVYNPQQQSTPATVYNPPANQTSSQNNDDLPSWNGFSAPPPEPEPQQQSHGVAPSYQHPPPYGQGYAGGNYGGPGYPTPGYGGHSYGPPGAPPGAPSYGPPYGYPQGGPGYGAPGAPPYGVQSYGPPGAPPYGAPGFGAPPYPPANHPYPPHGGAPAGAAASAYGFSAPPNSKEAEAFVSAQNTTNNQRGNAPPSNDLPPSYDDLPPQKYDANRKNQ